MTSILYTAKMSNVEDVLCDDKERKMVTFLVCFYCLKVLPIENKMSSPQDFRWVISFGMGVVTVLFAILGILGYLFCQDECKGSITLNLPDEGYVFNKCTLVFWDYCGHPYSGSGY